MNSIAPRQYLPIIKQISDPLDTTTYYVQAYIYKCVGNDAPSLVKTVNLVDRGGQRFTYQYQTPADVSGEGYFLSIITKVFTDSGYTTESSNYERTEVEHRVIERVQHFGGGTGVNYKKITTIIEKEVSGKIKDIEKTLGEIKSKKVNLDSIIKEIQSIDSRLYEIGDLENKINQLNQDLKKIEKNLDKKISENVLDKIKEVQKSVRAIKIPEPQKADLTPVIRKLNAIQAIKKADLEPAINALKKIQLNNNKNFKEFIERLEKIPGVFLEFKGKGSINDVIGKTQTNNRPKIRL